jgi:hypothetical protein
MLLTLTPSFLEWTQPMSSRSGTLQPCHPDWSRSSRTRWSAEWRDLVSHFAEDEELHTPDSFSMNRPASAAHDSINPRSAAVNVSAK